MFAIWGKTIYYLVYCYFGRIAAWMFFVFSRASSLRGIRHEFLFFIQ